MIVGLTPDQQVTLIKCTLSVATVAFGIAAWLWSERYWVYAAIPVYAMSTG